MNPIFEFWSRPLTIPPRAYSWMNLRIIPLIFLLFGANQVWTLAQTRLGLEFGLSGAELMASGYGVCLEAVGRAEESGRSWRVAMLGGLVTLAFAFAAFPLLGRLATGEFQAFLGTEFIIALILWWPAGVLEVLARRRGLAPAH